jgi:SAM-dependent methyltransferase
MSQSSLEIPSYDSDNITSYWDKKYLNHKDVWGTYPSTAAKLVMGYMIQNPHRQGRILDLGCGYGRDLAYFSQNGLDVIGVDISSKGIQMARTLFPDQQFVQLNFQKHSFPKQHFKYIYANFFFHLIPELSIRREMISDCYEILATGGLLFATLSSKNDQDYVNGTKVADNIVQNKRNVLKVFYDPALIYLEFNMFDTIEIIQFSEEHTHDTPHSHENHLVIAKKRWI